MKTVQETSQVKLVVGAADQSPSLLVDAYELTKPRMNFLVLITTMVGFLLASKNATNWLLLFDTCFGTALCAASAAVMNQWMERDYDALMRRTRNRPLVAGRIRPTDAVILGTALGVVGVLFLSLLVNLLTGFLGLFTIAWYLTVYTPTKRTTSLNTVIGALPGAIPPLMGFTAVQNEITPAGMSLFAILFFWQMPHFLAIAIMYRDDYRAGGFKMLPCVEDDSLRVTGRMMVLYAVALIPASLLPAILHMAGGIYAITAIALGMLFLAAAVRSAWNHGVYLHARRLFFASIIYLPLLLAALMFDRICRL